MRERPGLQELIEGFRRHFNNIEGCDMPAGSMGRCYELSAAFARYANSLDVAAAVLQLDGRRFHNDGPSVCDGHYVTWLPEYDKSVDWTARQFRPFIPCPLVQCRKELEDEWHVVMWKFQRAAEFL